MTDEVSASSHWRCYAGAFGLSSEVVALLDLLWRTGIYGGHCHDSRRERASGLAEEVAALSPWDNFADSLGLSPEIVSRLDSLGRTAGRKRACPENSSGRGSGLTDELSSSSSWRCYAGDHSDPDQCNSACTDLFQSSEDGERGVVEMDVAVE